MLHLEVVSALSAQAVPQEEQLLLQLLRSDAVIWVLLEAPSEQLLQSLQQSIPSTQQVSSDVHFPGGAATVRCKSAVRAADCRKLPTPAGTNAACAVLHSLIT
jgi:hypothetical protein